MQLAQAVSVLHRRGMVELLRPDRAVMASRAIRRYGAFGGLTTHTAARYGRLSAITDDSGTWTFRQLDELSNARARALTAAGGPGPVVGLMRRSSADFVIDLAAADKAGGRTVLLNTGFAAPQLTDVCVREGVTVVLADDEFADVLAAVPPHVLRLIGARVTEVTAAQSGSPLRPPRRLGGLVLLTSGTTGTPKGAPRARISPVQSAQLLDRVPWPADGAYYVAAPLFHATGLATCTVGLALGNRVVLSRRFDPHAALAAVNRYRVQALILVPTMLFRILELEDRQLDAHNTSTLSVVFTAGSSLSPQLCRRAIARFGEVLYNLYGSTEVATAAVATPPELRQAPGTVGRPPLGCTIAAYDERDTRIEEPGRSGSIYVSSGLSFSGYTDGATKRVLDGLLSTGDTGHFDSDGLWFIDGRDDDMVVCGGENVFPLEVENVLAEVPGVTEAAVIGVDDDDFGHRLRAFVVAAEGVELDADDIRAVVRTRLARYKVPRDVIFIDALPRNETGKVLKKKLAELNHADQAQPASRRTPQQ